jgi:hypothetical protein
MIDPDFYVPYGGGHLPMKIINLEVTHEGGVVGLQSVEMKIIAVSVGAPIYDGEQQPPARIQRPREIEL